MAVTMAMAVPVVGAVPVIMAMPVMTMPVIAWGVITTVTVVRISAVVVMPPIVPVAGTRKGAKQQAADYSGSYGTAMVVASAAGFCLRSSDRARNSDHSGGEKGCHTVHHLADLLLSDGVTA